MRRQYDGDTQLPTVMCWKLGQRGGIRKYDRIKPMKLNDEKIVFVVPCDKNEISWFIATLDAMKRSEPVNPILTY